MQGLSSYLVNLFGISSASSRPRWTLMLSTSRLFLHEKYSGVSRSFAVRFRHNFRRRLEPTTETLLMAMAALAIHGASMKPNWLKAPAAKGMPEKFCVFFRGGELKILLCLFERSQGNYLEKVGLVES